MQLGSDTTVGKPWGHRGNPADADFRYATLVQIVLKIKIILI